MVRIEFDVVRGGATWLASHNAVMNRWVAQNWANFLIAKRILSF